MYSSWNRAECLADVATDFCKGTIVRHDIAANGDYRRLLCSLGAESSIALKYRGADDWERGRDRGDKKIGRARLSAVIAVTE